MSLPPSHDTGWSDSAEGVQRRVVFAPGYDCRRVCQHDTKGEHGQHGDDYTLATRRRHAPEACTLTFFTSIREGRVAMLGIDPVRPSFTDCHLPYPIEDEDIRRGSQGEECGFVDAGHCFVTGTSGLEAEKIWLPDDTDAIGNSLLEEGAEKRILALSSGVWGRLLRRLDEVMEYVMKNASRLHRCPTCGGAGLVDPAKERFK